MRLLALALCLLAGCAPAFQSAAAEVRSAVDAVASVVDPLFEAATVACDSAERLSVARPSAGGQEPRDLGTVREACDRAFVAFDAVRRSQISAVALIRVAEATSKETDFVSAIGAVSELRASTEVARMAWSEALLVLKGKRR